MAVAWDILIKRAETLRAQRKEVAELLTFYIKLLGEQKQVYEFIRDRRGWLPSGWLAQDLNEILPALPPLIETVAANGPTLLADEARHLREASAVYIRDLLLQYWHAPTDTQFFGKAFLQPYAIRLAELDCSPLGRNLESGENRCPFCAGKPQLSLLKVQETGADGEVVICSARLAYPSGLSDALSAQTAAKNARQSSAIFTHLKSITFELRPATPASTTSRA